jgi:CspA family cold shock protein
MTTGTVKFFNENKGYGFIAPDGGGNDAFVHISAVERSGMRTLRQDQRVSYELQEDRRGKMAAVNLQPAEEATAGSSTEAPVDQSAEPQAE